MEKITPDTIIENELVFAIVRAAGFEPEIDSVGILHIWDAEIKLCTIHADNWGRFALQGIVRAV